MRNKKYLFWLGSLILAIVFNVSLAYAGWFSSVESEAEKKTLNQSQEQKTIKEEFEHLENEYQALLREKEHVTRDRDNIHKQIKILIKERIEYVENKQSLDGIIEENKALRSEKDSLKESNSVLTEEIEKLRKEGGSFQVPLGKTEGKTQKGTQLSKINELKKKISSLKNENNILAKALRIQDRELETRKIKKLKKQLVSLKKEKSSLTKTLKQAEKEAKPIKRKITKLEKELANTQDQLVSTKAKFESLHKEYKELAIENKDIRQGLTKIPKKFVKLAHQNKKLIKQTADMHYNLGVFYTRNKKYKQAAQEFLKAVEIRPNDVFAHYNLGFIYAEYLVNRPKAIKHFNEYLFISKGLDKDADKARKYILIWETYGEKIK